MVMRGTGQRRDTGQKSGLLGRRNKSRRVLDGVHRFDTLLSGRVSLQGLLLGIDHCIVHGTVKGDCRLQGILLLGRQAVWKGNIRAECAVISGTVEGDIEVVRKLELTDTARIHGRITSPVVAMAMGAVHEGELHTAGRTLRFEEKRKAP